MLLHYTVSPPLQAAAGEKWLDLQPRACRVGFGEAKKNKQLLGLKQISAKGPGC